MPICLAIALRESADAPAVAICSQARSVISALTWAR